MDKSRIFHPVLYVKFVFITSFFTIFNSYASITLPALFSNGVVLQQNTDVSVWGWADAGKTISITPSWSGETYTVAADKNGNWKTKIATPAGGSSSYSIVFSDGENPVQTLSDVFIGEVWICSGQSNMDLSVGQAENSAEEIKDADYPLIKIFRVPHKASLTPQKDVSAASWKSPTSATVLNSFASIPFFFSRNLFKYLDIPVGIIHAAWGSASQEAWLSEENIKGISFAEKMLDETRNGNPACDKEIYCCKKGG